MFRNETVRILNSKGLLLYGVLSRPDIEKDKKQLVISCQSGAVAKGEIGDHLRWIANHLAEQGVTVLRFDQAGTGESQGIEEEEIPIRQFFQNVQDGCFVDDTLTVVDLARSKFSNYDVYLMGECGGCISALGAGSQRLADICGYVLIAPPVLRFSDDTAKTKPIGQLDSQNIRKQYFQKLCDFSSWKHLLSGKSDFNLMLGCLSAFFKGTYRRILANIFPVVEPNHPSFNSLFWDSFQKIVNANRPVCFMLPDLDNETAEFNLEFKIKVLERDRKRYLSVVSLVLPETDHSIMFQKSRELLLQHMVSWIAAVGGNK